MNTFSLALLIPVTMVAQASSTSLRGSVSAPVVDVNIQEQQEDRRQLIQGLACRLFQKNIHYESTNSLEEWVCELPQEESTMLGGLQYVDIDTEFDLLTHTTVPLVSGQSTMVVTEALIDAEDSKLFIPSDALVEVSPNVIDEARRKLSPRDSTKPGAVLDALVIRVTDSKGVAPHASRSMLEEAIFADDEEGRTSDYLQNQYDKCLHSYGSRTIQPFSGVTDTDELISNGVVDVAVDFDIQGSSNNRDLLIHNDKRAALQQAALQSATAQLGDLNSDKYNVVLFCMPPGTGNWLSYGFVNSKFSFYNDEWCSTVPTTQVQCLV